MQRRFFSMNGILVLTLATGVTAFLWGIGSKGLTDRLPTFPGRSLLNKSNREAIKRHTEQSRVFVEAPTGTDETRVALLQRQAIRNFEKNNLGQALKDINEAISIFPRSSENFQLRGSVNLERKDYVAALNDFTTAIELPGTSVLTYELRAICHLTLGDQNAARSDRFVAAELQTMR